MARMANIANVLSGLVSMVAVFTSAMLLARLYTAELLRAYWPVVAFFFLDSVATVISVWLPAWGLAVYQISHLLGTLLACLALWRFSQQVFANYPPLREFAQKAVRYLVPICFILAAASLFTDPGLTQGALTPGRGAQGGGLSSNFAVSLALGRAADTAILAFLVALGLFAGWFPVRMKRNVASLLIGFMGLFLSQWIGKLAASTSTDGKGLGGLFMSVLFVAITLYWVTSLTQDGEAEAVSPVPAWNPQLLEQRTRELHQIQVQLSRRTLS
jgi:hypothetical protein